jgi:hypothetical protein
MKNYWNDMTHPICDSCETVKHCSQHGCIPLQPYPKQTTTAQDKSTKMDLKTLLDQTPRLRAWAAIGPVQHAELAQFVETVLNSRATGVTADGFFVEPGNQVWVISSTGAPKPATVQKTVALTNYELFGRIPVSESFLDQQNLRNYQTHNQ